METHFGGYSGLRALEPHENVQLGPACDAQGGKSNGSHMHNRTDFEDEMRDYRW